MTKEKSLKELSLKIATVILFITALACLYLFISLQPVIPKDELTVIRKDLTVFIEKYKKKYFHARYDSVRKIYSLNYGKDTPSVLKARSDEVIRAWRNNKSELPSEACTFFDKYTDLPIKLGSITTLPDGIIPFEKHPKAGSEIKDLLCILKTLRTLAKSRNEYDYVFKIQQIEMVLHSELTRSLHLYEAFSVYFWEHAYYLIFCTREIVEFVQQGKIEPGKAMKQLNALEKLMISPEAFWESWQLRVYEELETVYSMSDSSEPFQKFMKAISFPKLENAEFLHNYFPLLEKKIFLSGIVWMEANNIITYQHLKNFDGDVFKAGSAYHKVALVRSRMNFVGFWVNEWVWNWFMWHGHEPQVDIVELEKNRQLLIPYTRIIAAIEMFRKKEKRLPKDLAELLPAYLKDIPKTLKGKQEISYEINRDMKGYRLIAPSFLYDSDTGDFKIHIVP